MDIARDEDFTVNINKDGPCTAYGKSVLAMFNNDTARWVLLAACLRTQQSIAMSLFTGEYFRVYPGMDSEY